ncbi:MAG: SDR family oxidoreductase [Armatimonadetes bacterium]|nr:SDR family oxidoreductase [Armatimonadota bacterium]
MAELIKGKVAFVTGSGRGIGRCIALRLARSGADVAIHDIHAEASKEFGEAESLQSTTREIEEMGRRSMGVVADLTDSDATEAAVRSILEQMGRIDILVNCAGGDIAAKGGKPKPNTLFISEEDLRAVIDRNLMTTMFTSRAVVPSMIEQEEGRIINISSVGALYGRETEVAYGVAKSGVLHYTRCLAATLRPHGINANAICPGPTKSARFMATFKDRSPEQQIEETGRLTRLGEPEDVAKAVEFFASELSDYVTGQVLRVDGGWGGFPA